MAAMAAMAAMGMAMAMAMAMAAAGSRVVCSALRVASPPRPPPRAVPPAPRVCTRRALAAGCAGPVRAAALRRARDRRAAHAVPPVASPTPAVWTPSRASCAPLVNSRRRRRSRSPVGRRGAGRQAVGAVKGAAVCGARLAVRAAPPAAVSSRVKGRWVPLALRARRDRPPPVAATAAMAAAAAAAAAAVPRPPLRAARRAPRVASVPSPARPRALSVR